MPTLHTHTHTHTHLAIATADPQGTDSCGLQVRHPSLPQGLRVRLEHAGPGRCDHLEAESSVQLLSALDSAYPQIVSHDDEFLKGEREGGRGE